MSSKNIEYKLCNKCNEEKPKSSFKINRVGKRDEYQLNSCNKCCWSKRNDYLNSNNDAYIRNRFYSLRQHAKRRNLDFSITLEQVIKLFKLQSNICAYTGETMSDKIGIGLIDNTLSFDRWDSSLGYIPGNVLLCTKQINVCKGNLTLEKFKEYMPKLYENGLNALGMWEKEGLTVFNVGHNYEF